MGDGLWVRTEDGMTFVASAAGEPLSPSPPERGPSHVQSPDGAFTVKTLTVYDRTATYMVRQEQDSRGFQVLKAGAVGGDSGGYVSHHWEAPPFTYKGRKVRLKGTTFLASPDNHRLRMQISVDGGAFVNYGTLWWRREGTAKP